MAFAGMTGFSLLLTILLFRPALTYLVRMWGREDFSYGYFILPIVFYLVWEKREALLTTPSTPSWSGFIPFVAGIALYWLGELGGEFTALFLTLWLLVVGFCWLHLGWGKLKIVSFPLAHPLGKVPMTIGEWSGVRSTMEQRFLDDLKLCDYLLADYRNPQGKAVNVYVAYNESQRKGELSHSPDTCLPGSGWIFEDSGTIGLPVRDAEGNPTVIRRAFIHKDGNRKLTYYWFPQRGRVLTNMFQLKAYAFWDALTRRRTDGALVRLIIPVYGSEQPRDAEARLQRFGQEFVPVLTGFLPGKERW